MKMTCSELPEVLIIEPLIFQDDRGYFLETYHAARYLDQAGLPSFVQDNVSCSARNVVRGIHYQLGRQQGKLVMVLAGEIYDVVVDVRRGSPTFGRWSGFALSSKDHCQLYIPEGFAHGFCVTGETALVLYKCTDYYAPKEERGIRWNDPSLGISWPVVQPIVSEKDRALPLLSAVDPEDLPVWKNTQ
ncbi:MAG: dTDP-4-dehydrorhamnose 3,5-epimerase [Syntrophobacteraceae bacterium]